MARSFLVPLGLLAAASDPTGTSAGELYYNTTENTVYVYDGSAWSALNTGNMDGGMVDTNFGGTEPIDGGNA